MNPILCPLRNGIQLTKAAHRTFMAQDVQGGVELLYIDNASEDGTAEWLKTTEAFTIRNGTPKSVAQSWNYGLGWWFNRGAEYVLVVNNDVELLPSTYRRLLADGGDFVTAVSVGTKEQLVDSDPRGTRPHPDFSCYLIRRSVWEIVGPFDEQFKSAYNEDSDYHVRLHKAGVFAHCIDVSFYHVASGTIKNSTLEEQKHIVKIASQNHEYFKQKWGVYSGTPEYYALFESQAPESLPPG